MVQVLIWLIIGIYGIFYNITYIDEAKYLIKGWLITTGQIGYYSTPEFFYQHMPGGLLWYGLTQKIFGPSILNARIQSFLIGLLVLFFTYQLTGLIKPDAKKNSLLIFSLAPLVILYFSSAVPQSLAALALILGFYWLYKKRSFFATIAFTLAFIIRENFLFTLIFYLIFQKEKRLKNILLSALVILIFFLPGWPRIFNVLKNFPGVSWLLPISAPEKAVLGLNWMIKNYDWQLYWRAIKEFGTIYFSFLIIGLLGLINGIKQKTLVTKDWRWNLLLLTAGFNAFAHAWSAFNLTPRAIISYMAYFLPLIVVIASVLINRVRYYWILLTISLFSLNFASLVQKPNQPNTISILNQSAKTLRPLVADKQKIIWLAEPMSLYLAGKVSYYPLINHTNFYKPSPDTATVKTLGFWNLTMMENWLNEADLLVIDPNRLILSGISLELNNWQSITRPKNIWPNNLNFYSNKDKTL